MLDAGGRVIQETRHLHEDTGTTTSGRSKEEAQDYRYFPEPDLVPVAPPREWVEQIRASLPEAPAERPRPAADRVGRVRAGHGRHRPTPARSTSSPATVAAGASPADARKWWLGELSRRAHDTGTELTALAITPAQVARISELVAAGTLNDRLARDVIDAVLAGEGDPDEVVEARGLAVVSDDSALTAAVDEAIAANPEVAAKIRDGKIAAAGVLVGAVHEGHRGQADAARVRELILQRLS